MKIRLFIILAVFLLPACAPTRSNPEATITPDFVATDTANQIGTAIAARSTQVAVEALYTPTPTPGATPLMDLILTSAEANELAHRWSATPLDNTASVNPEYCKVECASLTWEGGAQGNSLLDIILIKAGSRDGAVTIFNEIKAAFEAGKGTEIVLPALIPLPEGTFGFEGQTSQNFPAKGLMTRQSSIVILIGLEMPDLGEEENLLLLSLYADRQIQKLIAAGH
jgi:hypothetical protein